MYMITYKIDIVLSFLSYNINQTMIQNVVYKATKTIFRTAS
jgi:hypothetical protein